MNPSKPYELLCGTDDFEGLARLPALPPFAESVLSFLASASADLLKDQEARAYPDVVTFAFFCRRANLERLRQDDEAALSNRLGRGLTFHVAPSNVPINFAYSLVSALLAGNACIVKASSLNFPQTRIVCRALRTAGALMAGLHPADREGPPNPSSLLPYVNVITYPRHRQDITERLSALCAVRLIWGGDETIGRVRQAPLPPQSYDVTFADRYSLLVIRQSAIERMDGKALASLAQGFYNDTFLTDQNACTTPRLVYWVADGAVTNMTDCQERFWQAVYAYAAPRYPIQPVAAVDKLTAFCRACAKTTAPLPVTRGRPSFPLTGGNHQSQGLDAELQPSVHPPDNLITRVQVDALTPSVEDLRCGGGFFVEYVDQDLEALAPIVRRNFQTLSYAGFDPLELRDWVIRHGLSGIDRIAPVGHTMDFSLTWDGTDLIRTLSRAIDTR